MRILKLEATGFKCFKETITLNFPDHCGLCLVSGENQVDPALGSNGAGKSTLWDAMAWCLYGKTARGLAAGTVESWGLNGTSCEVSLALEIAGEVRVVSRGRNPIHLTLDGEPCAPGRIDDLIGLSFERFLQVVLMGQFGKFFPDMKPADRLSLLSEVLDLEEWTRLSKVAADAVKGHEVELRGHGDAAAGLRGRREAVQEAASRAREDSEGYEATRKERLSKAREELHKAEGKVRASAGGVDGSASALHDGKATRDECEETLGKAEQKRRKVRSDLDHLEGRWSALVADSAKVEKRLKKTKRILGECPTCHRPMSGTEGAKLVKSVQLELDTASAVVDEVDTSRLELTEEENAARQTVEELNRELTKADTLVHDLQSRFRDASSRRSGWIDEAKRAEKAIDGIEEEENPHHRALERAEEELEALDDAIEESEVLRCDVQTQLDLLEFWPRGFKELRLWVIDQALDELAVHANNSLVELGLPDWTIEFSVERETQRGTISRGFGINVRSPESPDAVPWEAWSGGETQRLRVACAVGLSELIRSRMPDAPVIEVWDEPTEHLNEPDGVRDLVEFFSARSDTRQVWLIDHRALDSGAFDHVVTVVKEAAGSRVET